MSAPPELTRRSVVSFSPRGGRMTPGQRAAWERLWPRYGRDVTAAPLDAPAWFGRAVPLLLEIGSGMGETTAALAAAEPDRNHLAVEVYPPGLAQLLMRIEQGGLTNLRLLRGDALDVLEFMVAPAALAGIRVFFPDPWPKHRHHKRRLVQPGFVALAASRLAPGATLHLATDWSDYAEQMLAVCEAEPLLRRYPTDRDPADGNAAGYAPRPEWRPLTKFEARAAAEGRPCRDLIFRCPGPREGPQ